MAEAPRPSLHRRPLFWAALLIVAVAAALLIPKPERTGAPWPDRLWMGEHDLMASTYRFHASPGGGVFPAEWASSGVSTRTRDGVLLEWEVEFELRRPPASAADRLLRGFLSRGGGVRFVSSGDAETVDGRRWLELVRKR